LTNLPGTPPANRLITHKRIFRAVTSLTGTTDLHFVADINATDTNYIHNPAVAPDQEAATNLDFAPPPATLMGLTAMPNGIMAAFKGKELWFCEPYQPHAWPAKYMLTTNDWIVGLAAFGTSLAVLTTGTPYVVQGLHPDQMVMEKSEQPFPCVAKRSIVDMGYSAIYASTDGLVEIGSGGQARLISGNLWSRDQWQAKQPMQMRAGRIGSRYALAAVPAGGGQRRIELLDTTGAAPFVVPTSIAALAIYTQVETGAMFILKPDGVTIAEFDAPTADALQYTWRSKPFRFVPPQPMGAALASTEDGDRGLTINIYADGGLFASSAQKDAIWRTPSGAHSTWQIELTGTATVIRAVIAHVIADLEK
ncbi:MAG: hypothetical protein Q4G25_16475, partial [Paracoccus sp. (in: a-proteobacteria)]|nr:hypothetical protein [Paracoccus sp. (in: a-proteobacteria)]